MSTFRGSHSRSPNLDSEEGGEGVEKDFFLASWF